MGLLEPIINLRRLPQWLSSNESAYNAGDTGDMGSTPESGRFLKEGIATTAFLPGKFHGQRNLVGYSPWGRKELDTTE